MQNNVNFLSDGGEMGVFIRAKDWSKTPIGSYEAWPQSLQITLNIILNSKFPMFLFWGKELLCFYNDSFRQSLGKEGKTASMLGMHAEEAWSENWEIMKQFIEQIMAGEEAIWREDLLLSIYRNEKMEDTYWTFSFSPVKNESSNIGGVLLTCIETTQKILTINEHKESKEQLEFAIEATQLGTFDYNPITGKFSSNERLKEWFGLPANEQIELTHAINAIAENDKLRVTEAIGKAIKPPFGEKYDIEYTIIHPVSKKETIVHAKGRAWFNNESIAYRFNGTLEDVTEQALASKKIRESEERYHNLIISSPFAIGILKGENLVITTANQAIIDIWGKDWEIMGKAYFEALPELAEQGYKEVFSEVYKTGKPFNAVETPVHIVQNGEMSLKYYNFLLFPQRNLNQEIDGIGIIATEVTSQALFNKQIKENEKRFRLLADSMPQLIWTSDAKGNLNYYNKSTLDYSGLTDNKIKRGDWTQMIHPDDREENIRLWVKAIETGKDFIFEHRFRKYTGEYRWQLSHAVPQLDENRNIQMWVGTSTDIQDQKEFTDELEKKVEERTQQIKEKNIELEKINQELQSFTYVASHDLQEPLRKIRTFSSRILEKEKENLSDLGKDYFRRMQSASERMQQLINDLLSFSRINTAERKFETIELIEIVRDVTAELKEVIEEKNAIIKFNIVGSANIIPFQMHQLFSNLLSNSLKFTKPNVPPHITIESSFEKGIALKSKKPDLQLDKLTLEKKYLHLMISDNGIGFDPEFSERIFEIFQRLFGKSEYIGTGIGLAIVKKIVDNHNGFIIATSKLGEGATFDIFLPQT